MKRFLDGAIVAGLFLTLIFTALAHGAVEAWSVAVFELAVISLIVLCGVKAIIDGRIRASVPQAALPIIALVVLGIIQGAAFTGGSGRAVSLSVDAEATRAATLALALLAASFLIAANVFETRRRVVMLANFLAVYGFVMAVFAVVQHLTWNGSFYWLRPLGGEAASPFGPFVNRNHFAGYMELLLPLPLAMAVTRGAGRDARLFYLFAAAMMGVAAVMSLSRGGMISIFAEMIFIAVLMRRVNGRAHEAAGPRRAGTLFHRLALRPSTPIILLAVAILAGVAWVGPDRVINRVAGAIFKGDNPRAETFFESRGWVWRNTLSMIAANPITGVGLGAYETAYPIYSDDDGTAALGQAYVVDRAHNDYLQILADCGVAGGALALWFIAAIFRAASRGTKARDPLLRAFALGGSAGLFGMLVHSVFDFNLQLPSNALLFLVLAGAVSAVGAVAHADRSEPSAARAERVGELAYVTGVKP
jgi:O-antigen ligase